MRGFHRFRPAAQFESVDAFVDRFAGLRRLLGLLLVVHLQRQRYGQSGHTAGRESGRRHGQEIPFRARHGPRRAQTLPAGQTGLPQHAQRRPFLNAGPGRYRHARIAVVLRAALRRLQEIAIAALGRNRRTAAQPFQPNHVLPLLADWLLSRIIDGHRFLRILQSRSARVAVPGAIHATAPARHGLSQGITQFYSFFTFRNDRFSF